MMARADFAKTSPYHVHDTGPGVLEPWHLPHTGHRPNDAAEVESARLAGARMGGGMADVSRPVPLEHDRSTQHRSSRAADLVMGALAVGFAVGFAVGWLVGLFR